MLVFFSVETFCSKTEKVKIKYNVWNNIDNTSLIRKKKILLVDIINLSKHFFKNLYR